MHIFSISKLNLYLDLIRLKNPTGFLISFFPACFGIFLTKNMCFYTIVTIILCFIGAILARSAGCIINDICDIEFDKNVERTKNRPLANNSLSIFAAVILLIILLIFCLIILLIATKTAIYLGILAFCMMIIYPLTKRFTYFPQIFLGLTINLGCLISYSMIRDNLSFSAILMYISCCCWTIGYDTIYGFMDYDDDIKIGVKSFSILIKNKLYFLYIFYILFILLFIFSTRLAKIPVNYYLLTLTSLILFWQIYSLNIYDKNNCLKRFKSNNFVGFLLISSLI